MAMMPRSRRRGLRESALLLCLTLAALFSVTVTVSHACDVSDWSQWTACPCGGGLQTRSRQRLSAVGEPGCSSVEFTASRPCTGDGSTECHAAVTCQSLQQEHPDTISGVYWITGTVGRTPFKAYCDMFTAGGGWTLAYANSASSSVTREASYNELMSNPPGISVESSSDYHSASLVGMVDISILDSSNTAMVKDIGLWEPEEFSMIKFQFSSTLPQFLSYTLPNTESGACFTLPHGEVFAYETSASVKYLHSQLQDAKGQGYGWGGCDPPVPLQTTAASDTEPAPYTWLGNRNSSSATQRVTAIAGANYGDRDAVVRMFVRYDPVDVDCVVSQWTSWSRCSALCTGTRMRTRVTVTLPSGEGNSCPPLQETEPCNQDVACSDLCPVCKNSDQPDASMCHYVMLPGVCHSPYTGSNTCPSGTVPCVPGSGPPELPPRDLCSGCWPGTSGECQKSDTVCFTAAVTTSNELACPSGTELCSIMGSLEPEPRVIVDLTLQGLRNFTNEYKQPLLDTLAKTAQLPSFYVVMDSITPTGQDTTLGCIVVTPASLADAVDVSQRITAAIKAGEFTAAAQQAGVPVMGVRLNNEQLLAAATLGSDTGQEAPAGPGPNDESPASTGIALTTMILLGVAALLLVGIVAVLVVYYSRKNTIGMRPFEANSVNIPKPPVFAPGDRSKSFNRQGSAIALMAQITNPSHITFFEDSDDEDDVATSLSVNASGLGLAGFKSGRPGHISQDSESFASTPTGSRADMFADYAIDAHHDSDSDTSSDGSGDWSIPGTMNTEYRRPQATD